MRNARSGPPDLEGRRRPDRRRYTDEEILTQLVACAERLGRSPTMREFRAEQGAHAHPQTVSDRFGSWNAAKRCAGLAPRRFATREELLAQLRELGRELGRPPTGRDLETRRGAMPSRSLLWLTFGSLSTALREAGFDRPESEERLERAVEHGVRLARELGRLPRLSDWDEARRSDPTMLGVWQVYRLCGARRGAWPSFQRLVAERLRDQG
jgi:HNH endonuclease